MCCSMGEQEHRLACTRGAPAQAVVALVGGSGDRETAIHHCAQDNVIVLILDHGERGVDGLTVALQDTLLHILR